MLPNHSPDGPGPPVRKKCRTEPPSKATMPGKPKGERKQSLREPRVVKHSMTYVGEARKTTSPEGGTSTSTETGGAKPKTRIMREAMTPTKPKGEATSATEQAGEAADSAKQEDREMSNAKAGGRAMSAAKAGAKQPPRPE